MNEPERRGMDITPLPFAAATQNDVLFGRGKRILNWEGNRAFRRLVAEHAVMYHERDDPVTRDLIAKEVIDTIRVKGGRFLREATKLENMRLDVPVESWDVVPIEAVRRKVKQALRDAAAKVSEADKQRKPTSKAQKGSSYHTTNAGTFEPVSPQIVRQLPLPVVDVAHRLEHSQDFQLSNMMQERNVSLTTGGVAPEPISFETMPQPPLSHGTQTNRLQQNQYSHPTNVAQYSLVSLQHVPLQQVPQMMPGEHFQMNTWPLPQQFYSSSSFPHSIQSNEHSMATSPLGMGWLLFLIRRSPQKKPPKQITTKMRIILLRLG